MINLILQNADKKAKIEDEARRAVRARHAKDVAAADIISLKAHEDVDKKAGIELEDEAKAALIMKSLAAGVMKRIDPQAMQERGEPLPPPEAVIPYEQSIGGKRQVEYATYASGVNKEALKAQKDAAWATQHLTNVDVHGMDSATSILSLAKPPEQGGMGFIPGSLLAKLPEMSESKKTDVYSIATRLLMQDEDFIRKVAKEGGDPFETAAILTAFKMGWHPDWADPVISGMDDYEHRKKMREDEDKQLQEERVRRTMEETRPITPQEAAKYGIKPGATTGRFPSYQEFVASGKRFMSESDRKLYESVSSTLLMVDAIAEMAGKINTSGDDYASRMQHGAFLKTQIIGGTELGIIAKDYADAAQGIPRLLLPLMGEQGGRFTDKDMEQIVKQIPAGGLMPDGKGVATRKLERLRLLLLKKLETVHGPMIVDMKSKKKVTHKVVNGKLQKVK